MILYYLLIIPVLSVLVFVHELGHFVMAKRAGMKVEEFGFGFPPRMMGFQKGETTYSINWIPFGGFVKILGEDGSSADPRSFTAKKFLPRVGVIVAGVVMNFIMAVFVFMLINMIGSRVLVEDSNASQVRDVIEVQIIQVAANSPAQAAGLKVFDEVVDFGSIVETQNYIAAHKGQEITFHIKRNGQPLSLQMTPRLNPPAGQGALGIQLGRTGQISYAWYEAIWQGIKDAGYGLWSIIVGFGVLFKNLFTTGKAGVELAGPLGIAKITGDAASLGFSYLLRIMAFLSLNLAVINIVPFPALDGGRLLFLIIEKIKGSPLPKRLEQGMNTAGFVLLLLLMFFITTKDVLNFF